MYRLATHDLATAARSGSAEGARFEPMVPSRGAPFVAGSDGITVSGPRSSVGLGIHAASGRAQRRRRSQPAVQRRRDKASPRRFTANSRSRSRSRRRNPPREARSAILKRSQCREDPPDSGDLLVPRGGIEPPTRGFSVPSSPSGRASFPLEASVKHVPRPVKAGTPKHGLARSLNSTEAGDELTMGPQWMSPSRPTTGQQPRRRWSL